MIVEFCPKFLRTGIHDLTWKMRKKNWVSGYFVGKNIVIKSILILLLEK